MKTYKQNDIKRQCQRLNKVFFGIPVPGWAVRRIAEFSRVNYPNRLFSGFKFNC